MEYVLETNAVTKRYRGFTALGGLTMRIPKGAIYGFVGSDYSGGTLLNKLIAEYRRGNIYLADFITCCLAGVLLCASFVVPQGARGLLLGELAEKNLRLGEKLTHKGQRTTRDKLMSYLSAEARRLGKYEFDIPFSRQQLADYLAVERSGLSLELGKMKRDGLPDFHKSHFVLKV